MFSRHSQSIVWWVDEQREGLEARRQPLRAKWGMWTWMMRQKTRPRAHVGSRPWRTGTSLPVKRGWGRAERGMGHQACLCRGEIARGCQAMEKTKMTTTTGRHSRGLPPGSGRSSAKVQVLSRERSRRKFARPATSRRYGRHRRLELVSPLSRTCRDRLRRLRAPPSTTAT